MLLDARQSLKGRAFDRDFPVIRTAGQVKHFDVGDGVAIRIKLNEALFHFFDFHMYCLPKCQICGKLWGLTMWLFFGYFLLHLVIYTVFRAQFLIWNWSALKNLSTADYLTAFLYGLRFDLSALALPVGLFLLGWIWLSQTRWPKKIWLLGFTLINCSFIVLNFADSELLNFTARRFTKSSFFLFNDATGTNMVTPYLGMAAFTIMCWILYVFAMLRFLQKSNFVATRQRKALISLVVVVMTIVFSRGGLQIKPLTFVDAKIFDQSYANNLVLNSTFTLLRSFGKPAVERIHFFDNQKMLSLLNRQDLASTFQDQRGESQKMNVVYVFLESFSKEYLELKNPEATPYLNNLRKRSSDFPKAYANGRRSIEGVAALLSGIPALMEEPFINSEFSANQVIGLGTMLTAQNYHTSFFHGAQNGSMHFDQFMKSVGIQNYFGKNEYPEPADDDGTWGIYDEPFLKWTCEKISTFPAPFFTSIFTLTSHQPYNIPATYQDQFTDDRLPILKSIRYSDYAVEQFMKCAEKQTWYANTLFIFTADHTGPELRPNENFETRFQVPLIFFHPDSKVLENLKVNQFSQHIDVLPTLLETLKVPLKNKNYLARSLWQPGPKVIALYTDGRYQLVGDVQNEKEQLQAVQQYFSEGLFDNRLYYPVK